MLLEMTGQKSVPNVFINKTHVGGCDKTMQVRNKNIFSRFLFFFSLVRNIYCYTSFGMLVKE